MKDRRFQYGETPLQVLGIGAGGVGEMLIPKGNQSITDLQKGHVRTLIDPQIRDFSQGSNAVPALRVIRRDPLPDPVSAGSLFEIHFQAVHLPEQADPVARAGALEKLQRLLPLREELQHVRGLRANTLQLQYHNEADESFKQINQAALKPFEIVPPRALITLNDAGQRIRIRSNEIFRGFSLFCHY